MGQKKVFWWVHQNTFFFAFEPGDVYLVLINNIGLSNKNIGLQYGEKFLVKTTNYGNVNLSSSSITLSSILKGTIAEYLPSDYTKVHIVFVQLNFIQKGNSNSGGTPDNILDSISYTPLSHNINGINVKTAQGNTININSYTEDIDGVRLFKLTNIPSSLYGSSKIVEFLFLGNLNIYS